MSIKRNILASYVSQTYVTIIGIVIVPLYVKYMGAEAYGLVGFFAMLQAWFNLLDMGLTPTISRETARHRGGATDAFSYRRLVHALEGIFLFIALLGGGVLFALSGVIATDWLQASQLPFVEVQTALQLMAIIVAMRWLCGLYRAVISGAERLVWLGGFNTLVATMRFVGVLLVLVFVGITPTIFFSFQFAVAILELLGLLFHAYQLLPSIPRNQLQHFSLDWTPLKPVLKFSLTIAFTSSIWVLVTQTDKLLLSKLLPLAEYGHFTLAVLAASGVMIISSPISGAIMPRMAMLEAEGDHAGLIRIYRQATQLSVIVASAASLTLVFCAEPLLLAWTGDKALAHQAMPVLILYALGNGILAISAFPYYLQYAKGDLRLHLIGNAWFVLLLIPAIVWAVSQYGAVGAGYVWLAMNIIYFVTWVPLVHHKFEPGLNVRWFLQDVLVICSIVALTGYGLIAVWPVTDNRWYQAVVVVAMGLCLLFSGALASSVVRTKLVAWNHLRKVNRVGLV